MLNEITALFGETVAAAPPADRRATRRFVDLWTNAARGRYPSWRAMRDLNLGTDWDWAFCVDLEKSAGFPYFVYLGAHLAKLSDVYLSGDTDWTLSLLDKATGEVDACVSLEGPHFREDELRLYNGRRVLFRCVTAPLADNGEKITHVAGVVSGVFAD
ncbi:MAG: hypothetical protein ABL957_05885 [Parvularculaceae bacterium]